MSYLSVQNLNASYDEFELNVSFDVERKEFVSLIGPSGCGKTTVLSLLSGLIPPKGGKIYLDGRDITNLKAQERKIGMVFQDYALFSNMNVIKNIAYPLAIQKIRKKERLQIAKDYLSFIQLSGYEKRKVNTLSGGEKQRIALARALASKPNILLLDEPLSALDAALRRKLRSEIREIQQTSNTPFIYVTHDREEAFSLSDKVILMNNGKIEMIGEPEMIYKKPNSLFTAFFSGDGTALDANLIFPEDNDKIVFFRPEDVKLYSNNMVLDSKDFFIIENAKVLGYDYTGGHYILCIDYQQNRILCQTENKPKNSTISVFLNKRKLQTFLKN